MRHRVDGKSVVVTGAASGIGRSLSICLTRAGAHVWALDVDAEGLAALADEVGKFGLPLETRVVDVTSLNQVRATRDEIVAHRRGLDYWVNNAGVAGLGGFLELGADAFAQVVAVNLTGLVNGTRVALEAMEQAGHGRIVNMASMAGHLPAPYMTAYVATKHAVVGFTRSLTEELRLKGSPVSLLLVSPGFVDTRIIAKGAELGFPEWLTFLLAKPESVAAAVCRAMEGSCAEIFPTFNGRLMKRMYALLPRATVRSSRVLMTKSWKDLVVNRYTK